MYYVRGSKARLETAQESNHRNGSYTKTVNSGYGALEVTMPRDRAGTFTPQMVPKGSRRLHEVLQDAVDEAIRNEWAKAMRTKSVSL